MLFRAVNANPAEHQLMPLDLVPAGGGNPFVQLPVIGQALQIVHMAAVAALKMRVGPDVGVIALHWEGHSGNAALVRQQIEVPIDRSQTQAGVFRLQPVKSAVYVRVYL